MAQTIFHDIPRDLLAALLDREGSAADFSPRKLLGSPGPVSKHRLAQLYAGGFVQLPQAGEAASSPEFARAAHVILNPLTNLTFRLWGDESICAETTVLFPGDPLEDGGVILNPVGENYRLISPVGLDDVVALVSPAIPPIASDQPTFPFEGNFEAPVAAVLFGLIDMVRQAQNPADGQACYTASDLSATLRGQWGLTGFRQLTSYVAAVGLLPTPPSLAEVEYALELLVAAGVLITDDHNRLGLADSLLPFTTLLPDTVSGLQWQRLSINGDGDILTSHRVFVFGEDSLILSFAPMPQGRIFIGTTTASALKQFVVTELATLLPRRQTDRAPHPASAPAPTSKSEISQPVPLPQQETPAARKSMLLPVLGVMLLTPTLLYLTDTLGAPSEWKTFYAVVSTIVGLVAGLYLRLRPTRQPTRILTGLGLYFAASLLSMLAFDVMMIIRLGESVSGAEFVRWYLPYDALVALGISVLANGVSRLGLRR